MAVPLFLSTFAKIVQSDKLKVHIGRLLPPHLLENLKRAECVAGLHILVADHDTQVHVVRRLFAKSLHLHESGV